MKKMVFNYRFVPAGSTAPDPVTAGEIWVDVGNRAAPRVLDHHGGDTYAMSAFQLILDKFEPFISETFSDIGPITCVCHKSPDLDVISSVWLIEKLYHSPGLDQDDPVLQIMEQIISENDQGLVRTKEPALNWAVVMRTLIAHEYRDCDDLIRLVEGIKLVDKTYMDLKQGRSLEQIAEEITPRELPKPLTRPKRRMEKISVRLMSFNCIFLKVKSFLKKEYLRGLKGKLKEQRLMGLSLITLRVLFLKSWPGEMY